MLVQRSWIELANMWARPFDLPVAEPGREVKVSTGDITIYFPFGRGFTLFANPATSWFDLMATPAPAKERRVVTEIASYGTQLGWVLDLLVPLAEGSDRIEPGDLEKIKALKARIEALPAAA